MCLILLSARLFSAFSLWMDDESLQKQELYLPSLPKQYDAHRLATIMQGQQVRTLPQGFPYCSIISCCDNHL